MSWMVLAARAIVRGGEERSASTSTAPRMTAASTRIFTAQRTGEGRAHRQHRARMRCAPWSPSPARRWCREPASQQRPHHRARHTSRTAGEPVDHVGGEAEHAARRRAHACMHRAASSLGNGNFLLVDPLPAGFEIENPALVSSGSTASLPWLTRHDLCQLHRVPRRPLRGELHQLDRQARLHGARRGAGPLRHPGAFVEDMYRPEINARTATRHRDGRKPLR